MTSWTMRPTKSLLERKKLLLCCLVYTIVVTILFLLPGRKLPTTELPIDKVVHVLVNGGLFFLWVLFFFTKPYGTNKNRLIVFIAVSCIIYGIIIEVLQETMVPLRQADVWDIVANFVGIGLGVIVFYKVKHLFAKES